MNHLSRILTIVIYLLIIVIPIQLWAVTAYPYIIEYKQPDGSTLKIYLKGDEKIKWAMTIDSFTVLSNKSGFYEYANRNSKGDLSLSGIIAHNPELRSIKEIEYLSKVVKNQFYSASQLTQIKSNINIENGYDHKNFPTTGNRKMLCILIGFQDKPFIQKKEEVYNLFNQVGYNKNGAMGSVRDYYIENSYNQLTLNTTVVGPYKVSKPMSYYGGNDSWGYDLQPRQLVEEAINLADNDVNFSDYDNDGDGRLDGVYIIYAGYGEDAGAEPNAIWAHSWNIYPKILDGVIIENYACSAEYMGNSGAIITGIGVICHEFGHVLGSPDFYDTDYYESGGYFIGTGDWDVMASGSWNCNGKVPAHHNPYTKIYVYKWVYPEILSSKKEVTIKNSEENHDCFYQINIGRNLFLLENRQNIGFDTYLPGTGMLIYYVDNKVFSNIENTVNIRSPQLFYPVCASSTMEPDWWPGSYGNINSSGCPFPGSSMKTSFSEITIPSAGFDSNKPITNISEDKLMKTVSFDFMKGNLTEFKVVDVDKNKICLQWSILEDYDVLIARSLSNVFGEPKDGMSYRVGDIIEGGGTVVFCGQDSNFFTDSVDCSNSLYFYKIWPITKMSNIYCNPQLLSETICCEPITQLPFKEDFEFGYLGNNWINRFENGTCKWMVGKGNGWFDPDTAFNGNYNLFLNDNNSNTNDNASTLYLPPFNFSNYKSVNLSFYYLNKSSGFFNILYESSGNSKNLLTIGSQVSEWTKFSVDLPELSEFYQIILVGREGFGNGICIDDLEININELKKVLFNVNDGINPIKWAYIRVYDQEQTIEEVSLTSEMGVGEFNLKDGVYTYIVSFDGYDTFYGSFEVLGDSVDVNVAMVKKIAYTVRFNVTDGVNPLKDINIYVLDSFQDIVTNDNGQAVISLINKNYTYSICNYNYFEFCGSFIVQDDSLTINVKLQPRPVLYDLGLILMNGTNPIANSKIYIDDDQYFTNSDGAVMLKKESGKYSCKVSAYNFKDTIVEFIINNQNLSIPLTMRQMPIITNSLEFNISDGNNPLPNARVSFWHGMFSSYSYTNENGTVNFTVSNGNIDYNVEKDGYTSCYGNILSSGLDQKVNLVIKPIYQTKITLFSNSKPLSRVAVILTFENGEYSLNWTDEDGSVIFDVIPGIYKYSITESVYNDYFGEFTVDNKDNEIILNLTPKNIYNVSLNVYSGSDPLSDIQVRIGFDYINTNFDGQLSLKLMLGEYYIYINSKDFREYYKSFKVSCDTIIDVNLEPLLYPIRIYITNDGKTLLGGSSIKINNDEEILDKDNFGYFDFNLPNRKYDISINADGFGEVVDYFIVYREPLDVIYKLKPISTLVSTDTYSNLNIYPNPFNNYIRIIKQAPICFVKIVNLFGQTVLEQKIPNLTEVYINTSSLTKGMFLVITKDNLGNETTNKVIKL